MQEGILEQLSNDNEGSEKTIPNRLSWEFIYFLRPIFSISWR